MHPITMDRKDFRMKNLLFGAEIFQFPVKNVKIAVGSNNRRNTYAAMGYSARIHGF
jgi:hypothetical protein